MEITNLNFPQKIDLVIDQINNIKKLLEKDAKTQAVPQTLSLEKAVEFLSDAGYGLSKSSIYKLTSTSKIPFARFGGKLIFDRDELLQWCRNKTSKANTEHDVIKKLSATANKKTYYGR